MKWLKVGGIVFGVLVLILAVAPFFISLNDYIPRIEQAVAAKIKEPVSIKTLRVGGLPLPHVTIDGISIGKASDVTVGTVTIRPQLSSLLSDTKVIRSIEISGLVVTQKGIDKIPAWSKGDEKPGKAKQPAGTPAVQIRSVTLAGTILKLEKATFGPFDAKVAINAANEPEQASIVARDGKLQALITPEKKHYVIDVKAKGWTLPVGPPILFDELVIKGVSTLKQASLNDVSARLYGGTVRGKTEIGWEKGFQLKGDAVVSRVELNSLVPLFTKGARVSGQLDAKPVFSANATSADKIGQVMRLETPFSVRNGVLYGVDLQKAATTFIKTDEAKGGETRFDELSGQLAMDRGAQRFTNLKIKSGTLGATGNVTISPKKELSGRINAELKTVKMTAASIPLDVSGTVDSPLVFPTAAFLAGAAAGTAVLGPGLGTSVGATVGGWVEGLFGKKK